MDLRVPDKLSAELKLTERQWLLELAVGLFTGERANLGQAAQVAGISKSEFLDELARRRITLGYDSEDLAADVSVIHELERKLK